MRAWTRSVDAVSYQRRQPERFDLFAVDCLRLGLDPRKFSFYAKKGRTPHDVRTHEAKGPDEQGGTAYATYDESRRTWVWKNWDPWSRRLSVAAVKEANR